MRVLVATDGSATATAAAKTATKLLHPDARIELVTIIPERYDPELDAGGFEGPVMTEAEADQDWEQAVSDGRQALADAEVALGGGLEAELVPTDESAGRAIVHVATDAANSTLPLWLVEGFADYVALRDVQLPLSTTAGQILTEVRKKGAPRHLPGPAEFDTTRTHLGASYEAAWTACRLLAERYGERQLVDYYRSLSGGAEEGPAFRRHFGLSLPAFTRSWRGWLAAQAGRLG